MNTSRQLKRIRNLGLLYRKGEIDESIRAIDKGIELADEEELVTYLMYRANLKLGKGDKSFMEDVKRVEELGGDISEFQDAM